MQILLGRAYISEHPKGSDLYRVNETPLLNLTRHGLPLHCRAEGALVKVKKMSGQPILKSTELRSNSSMPYLLARKCGQDHAHYHLRGGDLRRTPSNSGQRRIPTAILHSAAGRL